MNSYPPTNYDSESPPALTLGEVEKGVNYAIVISTNGGLWRYMIGDTIVFTSTDPYRFRISGRTRHFINAFGEEVIVENADKALEEACKEPERSFPNTLPAQSIWEKHQEEHTNGSLNLKKRPMT